MEKAITLIKEIDKLATVLIDTYSLEEVNEAFKKFKADNRCLNYITSNIYIPQEDDI